MTSHTDNSAPHTSPEAAARDLARVDQVLIDVLKIEGLIAAAVETLPDWQQAATAAKFQRHVYNDTEAAAIATRAASRLASAKAGIAAARRLHSDNLDRTGHGSTLRQIVDLAGRRLAQAAQAVAVNQLARDYAAGIVSPPAE